MRCAGLSLFSPALFLPMQFLPKFFLPPRASLPSLLSLLSRAQLLLTEQRPCAASLTLRARRDARLVASAQPGSARQQESAADLFSARGWCGLDSRPLRR